MSKTRTFLGNPVTNTGDTLLGCEVWVSVVPSGHTVLLGVLYKGEEPQGTIRLDHKICCSDGKGELSVTFKDLTEEDKKVLRQSK